ncbi:MAG: ATP-grasp fold amidoligase family protein [Amphiplicatus sp.]
MAQKRKSSWLALEWTGTVLFGLLPDCRPVNLWLSKVFYLFYNKFVFPDLKSPRYFNEKLMALKNSEEARDPLRARVTDKELVKHHVTETLGPGHVAPTLAVLKTAREVDGFDFPLPCVVKPTHSSQEVLHLSDRQPTGQERRLLKYWLWKSYFAASREPNYRRLDKKLIVEPVIGKAFGEVEDIKVLCFHGRPKLIQVDHGRYREHRRDYFDSEGRRLPVTMRKPAADLPFPHAGKLAEIVGAAARLSAGFAFIRVDFYVVEGRLLVGELTSFPTNCTIPFQPLSADMTIARLFDEPDLEVTPALFESAAIVEFPPRPAREAGPSVAGEGDVVAFPAAAAIDSSTSSALPATASIQR